MISVLSDAFLLGGSGCGSFYYVWTAFLIKQRQVSARPEPKAEPAFCRLSPFCGPSSAECQGFGSMSRCWLRQPCRRIRSSFGVDNDEDFDTCDSIRVAHPGAGRRRRPLRFGRGSKSQGQQAHSDEPRSNPRSLDRERQRGLDDAGICR